MEKRGQVEVQFNWIFILVAGAVILIFFGMIAVRQQGASVERQQVFVSRTLETLLTGAETSPDAASAKTLAKGDFSLSCEGYGVGTYFRDVEGMKVFGPDFIKGKEVLFWSVPWKVPFPAGNFLFVTSPQVRYVLVYDMNVPSLPFDEDAAAIISTIQQMVPQAEIDVVDFSNVGEATSLPDRNSYKLKFVFFGEPSPPTPLPFPAADSIKNTAAKDITAVVIKSGNRKYLSGALDFYRSNADRGDWESYPTSNQGNYYQLPTILAAIFSENKEMYDCVMGKHFKRLNYVAEILHARSNGFVTGSGVYSAADNACKPYHTAVVSNNDNPGPLTAMKTATVSNIPHLEGWAGTLSTQNNLLRSESCALIY